MELFILGCVQGITWHIYFRLSFIPVCVQTITAAQYHRYNTKNLQVKKEYRGVYPIVCEILYFGVLNLFCLIHSS